MYGSNNHRSGVPPSQAFSNTGVGRNRGWDNGNKGSGPGLGWPVIDLPRTPYPGPPPHPPGSIVIPPPGGGIGVSPINPGPPNMPMPIVDPRPYPPGYGRPLLPPWIPGPRPPYQPPYWGRPPYQPPVGINPPGHFYPVQPIQRHPLEDLIAIVLGE